MAGNDQSFGHYQNYVDNPNPIWKSENVLRFYLPQFTVLMFFVVSVTRLVHYILRPLNQPPFVAEFLAGLFLCPQLFAGSRFSELMLPVKAVLGIETMAHVSLIYNIFLTGMEMNLDTVLLARKKATTIAIAGTIIPMVLGVLIYSLYQSHTVPSKDDGLLPYNTPTAYLLCALALSVTNFPVLAHILADLKILYTGLGRVALSAATINDFYNWAMFVVLIPFATHSERPFLSLVLTTVFVIFCHMVLRPSLERLLVNNTEKNEWDNYQLSYAIIGVFACAHVTEMLGTNSIVGALVYGLIFPRGKFADLLMERSDDIVSVYLEPLFFVSCGVRFDLTIFRSENILRTLQVVIFSCIAKVISTVIATGFYSMSFRDGAALGALMNTKGILPMIMLNIASDKQILSSQSYSTIVLGMVVMTVAVSPIINYVYKPRKRFEKEKLRTIQNLKGDADIRVMACVHNARQVQGMINILEASSAINVSPLRVFGVQLVELKGRGTAFLTAHIDHSNSLSRGSQLDTETVSNLFAEFAPENDRSTVESLAAVSSFETIHKDIYNIAEEKLVSLILLPFHKQSNAEGCLEVTNSGFKDINQNVMQEAPCSVGILVDRGHVSVSKSNLRIGMVFIGGPDDREALAIAWRMAKHGGVHLSMVRILLFGKAAEVDTSMHNEAHELLSKVLDSRKEKEMDEESVSSFRLMAVNNEDSITYTEREVHSGDDIPCVLNELDKRGYDVYILGQGQGRNSMVLSSMLEWTDCPELGVIGDMLASNSFGSNSSLLVVHQYGFGGTDFRTNHSDNLNNGDSDSPFGKASV
ncbi:hypothetical protein VNO77_09490 [Canavalia gladiata]|uniref:Cation/H+ exchanger domain-containing protein n=1 Tax=Canavalia gladiata TaxID=3824 RepID=A0AAN9QU88_CANGL